MTSILSRYVMACILAASLLAFASAEAQTNAPTRWTVVNMGQSAMKKPNCHSLQYFMDDPANAERQNDPEAPPKPKSARANDLVKSERVGKVGRFEIYSIIANIENSILARDPLYIKMILVERKPGEFCEIYNDLDETFTMAYVRQAHLMNIGSETVLASNDLLDGTGGITKEAYWTFDQDGPAFLDYSTLLDETLKKLVPKGNFVQSASFNMSTLSFRSGLVKEGGCLSCDSNGSVSIQFAIQNHRLVVVSETYEPPKLP